MDEPAGEQQVPLIDAHCDLQPSVGEGEEASCIHDHEAPLPQQAHGPADAGLGEAQVLGHVDGAHGALFPQGQDGLQVVFRGFVDVHGVPSQASRRTADGYLSIMIP